VIIFFDKAVIVFMVGFGTGNIDMGNQVLLMFDQKLVYKFRAIIGMELEYKERQPSQEVVKTIFHGRELIAIDGSNFAPTGSHID